jgi:hypothetical protein
MDFPLKDADTRDEDGRDSYTKPGPGGPCLQTLGTLHLFAFGETIFSFPRGQ